ncbi:DNA-3-methyladenine glycosylase 2 family protein [Microlunatus speluncae]|uniref:DNA-3-methyladenine glycosylase 2 family protein n=1 Tax=Microlunatus speluncae TaxID=2594267 RepID=UPI001266530B|nr:AlkA N-terminal domain-containing protein [Microlunatus speluncae]
MPVADLDPDTCFRAADSRDARFDGIIYIAVRTTRIYCRPSCPATMPKPGNLTFYPSAAAAQRAGYRACRRCRPDATPGSPEWDFRADAVGRAMRLIADGVVEREGVAGLAARTGYSTRQLNRLMLDRLGAGPLALARSQRAHTARILIEQTAMSFADVAFAAGFSSVRQFNDTIRVVYASTPRGLRAGADRHAKPRADQNGRVKAPQASLRVDLDLAVRRPFDGARLITFLADRAIAGVETVDETGYRRTLALPGGPAVVRLRPGEGHVRAELALTDLRDLASAVERCRRLLDLDADPVAIDETLAGSALLGPLVRRRPGLRAPGHVDGFEVAVRAIVGQQVSVAGARTVLGRIAEQYGSRLQDSRSLSLSKGRPDPPCPSTGSGNEGVPDLVFPGPIELAVADPADLPMPRSRGRALVVLAGAVADGGLSLDRSADRAEVRRSLLALPGIGPWTADYIAMRALGDPDVWLGTDLGVRHALTALAAGPATADQIERCRPWRSYAVMHLWHAAEAA